LLSKIENYQWITMSKKDYMINYATVKGLKRKKPIICIQSINAVLKLVAEGIGISMLPSHLISNNNGLYTKKMDYFKKEFIYLNSLNYTKSPKHISNFINTFT